MKIKPSKRPKKRYVVFELTGEDTSQTAAFNAIKALKFADEANLRFLKDKYRITRHRGVVRVNLDYSKQLIEMINAQKNLKTVGMSGILKKAEAKYLRGE